jgi:hypothetical protein
MSKKKNTLKDLDEFLKQQAASLVSPEKLNVQQAQSLTEETRDKAVATEPTVAESQPAADPTFHDALELLKTLAKKNDHVEFRKNLYDLLLNMMDAQHYRVPEDKIFINTILYLKHEQHWKDGIREYWQHHE